MPNSSSAGAPTTTAEQHGLTVEAGRRPWILAATMAAIFMCAIEGTIVATAVPTIVGDLGRFDLFSWVFTAYVLTQAITIPIYGRLADLYGRKLVLLFGIFLFLIGSVLCGLASSMVMLIAFRVVQGIGTGAIQPIALTVFGDLYPPAVRARMQAILSSTWASGAILGPLIGAALIARLSWATVFWINVPFGLVAAAMLQFLLHERIERRQHRIDYLGSALMSTGIGLLMIALVEAERLGGVRTGLLVVVAAALLGCLFVHESRTPEPMLPLALWRSPIIAAGNAANLGIGAMMMAATAFLPAYIQGVMGASALVAGLALTTMSVSWSAGSTISGRLMLRTSYRTVGTTGGCLLVLGSLLMIELDPARGPLWAAGAAACTGLGMGLVNNSFLVAIQSSVDWAHRGIATSSVVFTRMIGQAVGTAIFAGILNAGLTGEFADADIADRLMDPALRAGLPAAEIGPLMRAIAAGLHHVYLIDGLIALAVMATPFWMPVGLSPVRSARERPARL